MAEAQFSGVTLNGDTLNATYDAPYDILNASQTMLFIQLGAEDVVLRLPTAVAGRMFVVAVSEYTVPVGTTGVVRVVPFAYPANTQKVNGVNEVVTWQLHSQLTFFGVGAAGWEVQEA